MKYTKPQVACPTNALIAIQSTPFVKQAYTMPDNHGDANKKTISAYEGDD